MKKIYVAFLFICQIAISQSLTIDSSFNTGTGFEQYSGGTVNVNTVVVQPDNKIIVAGQYTKYNSSTSTCLTRLNPDGTKDTTFNVGTGTNAGIWGCILQADGKIIIYGGFTTYNGVVAHRIIRLNANGTRDTSFANGIGANDYVESAKIQADGKIIIVGRFTSYTGVARNRIARINSDGSLDASFSVVTGADNRIRDFAIQTDGKIVVGGDFNNYNGVAKRRIVRLNTDGSIDDSYTIGTGALSNIWRIAMQADNKAIIGGEFQSYNGVTRGRIARINTDGTLDTSFSGPGANSTITCIYQSDNKIYIGGSFTTYNGVSRAGLARLNADGSIDASMTIGNGFDLSVRSIAKQSDNKLLIGGDFITYNDVTKNRIVRLNDATLDRESFSPKDYTIYPNPAISKLYIKNSDKIDSYTLSSIDGKLIEEGLLGENYLNIEHLPKGVYLVTLFQNNSKVIRKFIKG